MSRHYQARRRFLKNSLACAVAGSGAGAMTGKLNLVGSALADSSSYAGIDDYKALVCVFLYGGSDSFNLFVPSDSSRHSEYSAARGSLAIDQSELLPASDGVVSFNKNLPGIRQLYEEGNAAILANVGNLISPVTRAGLANGSATIPSDLFAHNHQQEQWQKGLTSRPSALVGAGWGGRMADMLREANAGATLPPTFTVAGSNYFQSGNYTAPVSVNAKYGPKLMDYMDANKSSANAGRDNAMAQILALDNEHILKQFAGSSFTRARDSSRLLAEVMSQHSASGYDFTTKGNLGEQLQMVARLIAGRDIMGQKRQIFFVGMGGWDTHDAQSPRMDQLTKDLDKGLSSFQQELASLGVAQEVTTFTASDFGRTLTVNGDGSDHGWGGHYLVLGGAVNGKKLIGDWPSYVIGGDDDTGDKGRVIPSISVNQYGAALASWMGLSNADIASVFPDLANFDNTWQNYGLFD
ncbi:DUF1501 domain-containing protein [Granulosicoccus antarcticus]|uniref:Tat pathway signal protein n=1 Tax=Granulosicoccus antarcticus IMCC3135 TaxID=1192854 RepID=A0A2Z2NT69_9GAMM|nr:DUF1501 domain-containing protein [Granulosicoccus antarcticus]ASJ74509.1 hypothetical protein IMCC3135_22190 [Granulosicoccus antarcticus IMCC3135]